MPGLIVSTNRARTEAAQYGWPVPGAPQVVSQFDPGAPVALANNFEGATLGALGVGTQGPNDELTVVKVGSPTVVASSTGGDVIHGSTSARIDTATGETVRL